MKKNDVFPVVTQCKDGDLMQEISPVSVADIANIALLGSVQTSQKNIFKNYLLLGCLESKN